ncbi:hypothetical protein DSOUD_1368 [Desulfuromonas soudanensis]|uniref:Right handed beta helix domain-containing protein n=1 Tax=Desulfuromonas soudanensis TaxID=1603606 RepID=A0A0M5IRC8_9BACT|nr:right-handed parallel beta-helix repeat-containing protein [Desulfuromonas soudanensis]ALC16148.1 hypothetical protein DSOUD_1368 [Desulfuromonas soudanensis]
MSLRGFLPCRAIVALLCSLPFLTSCLVASPPVSGSLEGDHLWRGTVRIAGDLVVAEGAHLVIAPGSEIVFLPPIEGEGEWTEHPHFPGSELIVRGSIAAEGTADKPITFRYLDAAAPPGSWGGVNLVASPHARFRYCRFTQADSALHSQGSTVSVEDSLFENNLVGIRFHSSEISIEHNLLRRNGTAIRFHFGAPVISRNDIRDNDKGFFVTSYPRDYRIEGNNIVGNGRSVVLGEEVPDDLILAGNFWGETDPARIEDDFVDGRRIDYLGEVLYRPFAGEPFADAGTTWNR